MQKKKKSRRSKSAFQHDNFLSIFYHIFIAKHHFLNDKLGFIVLIIRSFACLFGVSRGNVFYHFYPVFVTWKTPKSPGETGHLLVDLESYYEIIFLKTTYCKAGILTSDWPTLKTACSYNQSGVRNPALEDNLIIQLLIESDWTKSWCQLLKLTWASAHQQHVSRSTSENSDGWEGEGGRGPSQ